MSRQTDKDKQRQVDRRKQADGWADRARHMNRQTNRQTHQQVGRQKDGQTINK